MSVPTPVFCIVDLGGVLDLGDAEVEHLDDLVVLVRARGRRSRA